jgi:hypothetical protein
MDAIFLLVLLGLPLGYLALQLHALASWRGRFRAAALAPALGWLLWGLMFAVDVTRDPSSHNLFPFEIMLGSLIAAAYLAVLAVVRWLVRRRAGDREACLS